MILRFCLSILVLVHLSASDGSCLCYPNQNGTTVYTPTGPRNSVDYSPCYPDSGSCFYTAKTDNDSVSLCHIQFVNFQSSEPNTTIVIYDDSGNITLTPDSLQDSGILQKLDKFVSQTSVLNISMLFFNKKTASISFYFYTCPRPDMTTLSPTTPGQTFPTVSGAPSQSSLVGADIAFAFVSAGNETAMFKQMTDAINGSVKYFNVVQSKNESVGVRLGLLAPSQTDKPNTFGDQWNLDLTSFTNFLGVLPQMIEIYTTRWEPALKAFLADDGYFDSKNDNDHKPRANVQKIFAFFTQTSPSDLDLLKPYLLNLTKFDVHMVVFDARSILDPDLIKLRNDPEIKNFAYTNLGASDNFLFNYVLQSDIDFNYGCTYQNASQEILSSGLNISWPLNFDTAQYCNNQDTRLTLVSKNTTTDKLCVNIPSYELETEKDYLRFYDADGKEIASFTGMDVTGSKFMIPGKQTTVNFQTNENTIYNGVQFKITAATSSDTCP